MKILVPFFILLFFFAAPAQRPTCTLAVNEAPALRNLKLGMTVAEVEAVLGEKVTGEAWTTEIEVGEGVPYKERTFDLGVKRFSSNRLKSPEFDGVTAATIFYYEDRVIQVALIYKTKWKDSREFTENLSEQFKIPKEAWLGDTIYCNGFKMVADADDRSDSSILITDTEAMKKLKTLARQKYDEKINKAKQAEDDKKKAFKP